MTLRCTGCHREYSSGLRNYRCPQCQGLLDLAHPLVFDADKVNSKDPSLWRYRHTFPLQSNAAPVSLGEGSTPLIVSQIDDSVSGLREVFFKLEYLNPTGSHKDRGTTILVSALRAGGVTEFLEDSSGNAGASCAAYAARAEMLARVFVPNHASGGKIAQIEAFGAEVVRIAGPRSNASTAVEQAAVDGVIYASHVFNPLGLAGIATMSYEIVEQLDTSPGTVILPVGNGVLLLGIYHGFLALLNSGIIKNMPHLVGVQAEACAPLWARFNSGLKGTGSVNEGQTVAEGIRIVSPPRGDLVLAAVRDTDGSLISVNEAQIMSGWQQLAKRGLHVEPTSAVVWAALQYVWSVDVPGPVVAILTGSGLKSIPNVSDSDG